MGRSGTGLGLTIVWNTAHDHGGQVEVSSDHSGSCFRIRIPATDEAVLSDQEQPIIAEIKGRGEAILVVDDEEIQRDVIQYSKWAGLSGI